jgi:ssDNA-binding Zn-finger/Zn-ribbon topoisomerase 1
MGKIQTTNTNMNNNTKTKITCPYCKREMRNNAALSAHLRAMHPEQWKGNVRASIASPSRMPINVTLRKGGIQKGSKKKPIKNTCPICGYTNYHPPGMARHIQAVHPEAWKGNLGESLGKKPSRVWKEILKPKRNKVQAKLIDPEKEERLRKRRIYQKQRRDRFYTEGKNSRGEIMPPGWKPRGRKRQYRRIEDIIPQAAVQPEPKQEQKKPLGPTLGHIDFCPNCGHNIRAYELAKGMMDITNANQT